MRGRGRALWAEAPLAAQAVGRLSTCLLLEEGGWLARGRGSLQPFGEGRGVVVRGEGFFV